MRLLLRIVLAMVVLVALTAGAGAAYLKLAFPKVGPAPQLNVTATPEKLARGAYLANHVSACIDCHSMRDWTRFAAPIQPGTEGAGGQLFSKEMGLPGTLVSKNITPTGLSSWTDGEIAHAITTGVTRTGRAMFPLMPYPSYGKLAQDDLEAIIVYLRSLKPIPGEYPDAQLEFPMSLIVNTIPRPADPQVRPDPSDTVAYGRYLARVAGCMDCHTPIEHGAPVEGKELAGGFEFGLPFGGLVRSLNITPDMETGIGGWDRAFFIARFKKFGEGTQPPVAPGEFNTIMPWTNYAGMTESDLGAIYDYLRTVPPVKSAVERFTPKKSA